MQAAGILAHRVPAADRQIGHRIAASKEAAHAAVIEQHLWHRALGLVALDRPGEGAGKDQIAAVVLVVEDRSVAFERARRRSLLDKLVFEHERLALGTGGKRFRLIDEIDQFASHLLNRAVTLLRGAAWRRSTPSGKAGWP